MTDVAEVLKSVTISREVIPMLMVTSGISCPKIGCAQIFILLHSLPSQSDAGVLDLRRSGLKNPPSSHQENHVGSRSLNTADRHFMRSVVL